MDHHLTSSSGGPFLGTIPNMEGAQESGKLHQLASCDFSGKLITLKRNPWFNLWKRLPWVYEKEMNLVGVW